MADCRCGMYQGDDWVGKLRRRQLPGLQVAHRALPLRQLGLSVSEAAMVAAADGGFGESPQSLRRPFGHRGEHQTFTLASAACSARSVQFNTTRVALAGLGDGALLWCLAA